MNEAAASGAGATLEVDVAPEIGGEETLLVGGVSGLGAVGLHASCRLAVADVGVGVPNGRYEILFEKYW